MIRNVAILVLAMLPLLLTSIVFSPAVAIALITAVGVAWAVRPRTLPWSIAGLVNALLGLLLVSIWGMVGAPIALIGVACGIADRRAGRSLRLAAWSLWIGAFTTVAALVFLIALLAFG